MDLHRLNFISRICFDSITACQGTRLFPSVMMAQACLEGNDGQSQLASKYNNHFGMKAGSSWKGKVVDLGTDEFVEGKRVHVAQPFRVYASFKDGMADHVALFKRVSLYAKAGVFTADTPEAQAQAIQNAGYATDPKYAQKLIAIIQQYNLKQYDSTTHKQAA